MYYFPWEANDRFLSKSDRPPSCFLLLPSVLLPVLHTVVFSAVDFKPNCFINLLFMLIWAFLHFYLSGLNPTRITLQNHDGGNARTGTCDITKDDVIGRFAT